MGRPRKVVGISKGKIGKESRLNRQIQEGKLKVDRDALEAGAPDWLPDRAAREYNRVVFEAGKIDLLDNLDLAVLAIYAENYSRYIDAVISMQQDGLTVEGKFGDIPSPYVRIASEAAKQILQCSTKLGLAATDRLKLIVPTKEEKKTNKFLQFME